MKKALAKFVVAAVVVAGTVAVPASEAFASKGVNGAPKNEVTVLIDVGRQSCPGPSGICYTLSADLGGFVFDPSQTSVKVEFEFEGSVVFADVLSLHHPSANGGGPADSGRPFFKVLHAPPDIANDLIDLLPWVVNHILEPYL